MASKLRGNIVLVDDNENHQLRITACSAALTLPSRYRPSIRREQAYQQI
jgi:hypothetical protein